MRRGISRGREVEPRKQRSRPPSAVSAPSHGRLACPAPQGQALSSRGNGSGNTRERQCLFHVSHLIVEVQDGGDLHRRQQNRGERRRDDRERPVKWPESARRMSNDTGGRGHTYHPGPVAGGPEVSEQPELATLMRQQDRGERR